MNYDYKINISEKNNAHTQCLEFINANTRVLDVGCAVGALGEYLSQEKNCEVVGLDCSAKFIEFCRRKECYKDLFQIDLNEPVTKLEEYKRCFDYILLADVIEHLYDPKEVLKKLLPFLKDNGSFILSIPNIAHASTKLNLLDNKFKYTEMGLLDKTHIRFFTRTSIIELIDELGFNIVNDNLVLLPFSTYYEPVDLYLFPDCILNSLLSTYESFVYQYILEVKVGNKGANDTKLIPSGRHVEMINNIIKDIKKRINKIKRKKFFSMFKF